MKPLCIYHSPCQDGFSALWAVWKRFGDELDFHPGVHGEAPPDVRGRHVILVDFSYKAPVMFEMAKQAASILVLDHHKSAEEALKEFPNARSTWEEHMEDAETFRLSSGFNRIGVQFEMQHSGAVMAWRYFHPGKLIPRLLLHVEDRDLWKFSLAGTRDICAAVFSRPYDLYTWDNMVTACEDDYLRAKLVDEGAALNRKQAKDIAELIAATERVTVIGGYQVPIANLPYTMASEAGNIMAHGHPFAATYYDGRVFRHFSLRSVAGGVDVSEVARKYGGGGHMRAAGFQAELGWDGDLDWGTAGVP